MEPQAFDTLSRQFANGTPRRSVLKTLAVACLYGAVRPVLRIRIAAAAQACNTASVTACIQAANDTLERETADCSDVPQPAQCRAAAVRRHNAAVKACNPCPADARCESDVCCPNSQA